MAKNVCYTNGIIWYIVELKERSRSKRVSSSSAESGVHSGIRSNGKYPTDPMDPNLDSSQISRLQI